MATQQLVDILPHNKMADVKVKLPRYIMLKNNGNNLRLTVDGGENYLKFNSTAKDLSGSHEVVQVSSDIVMIKSLDNGRYWRRSPDWIWADYKGVPSSSNKDCLFRPVQVSPKIVAFECLANGKYLRTLTTDGKTDALNAIGWGSDEVVAQMEVAEAVSARRLYNLKYLTELADITDQTAIILGTSSASNDTIHKADLNVKVSYQMMESRSWKDSNTFKTGLEVSITAGVPMVADASVTVSSEISITQEMGKESTTSTSYESSFTVKDVSPGEKVKVEVSATRAKSRVPYTYTKQDTLVNGAVVDPETGDDGVFEGVKMIHVEWKATDGSGKPIDGLTKVPQADGLTKVPTDGLIKVPLSIKKW